MNKKIVMPIALMILLFGLTFISASIVSTPPCFITGEIKEINFQEEYYEYNSTLCDALPCTPYDRLIPAQYIIKINITEISGFKERKGFEGYCNSTYFNGEEKKFSVYASSMKIVDNLKVNNIIEGNVTTSLEKTFFINNQYILIAPSNLTLESKTTLWQKIVNWLKNLFS